MHRNQTARILLPVCFSAFYASLLLPFGRRFHGPDLPEGMQAHTKPLAGLPFEELLWLAPYWNLRAEPFYEGTLRPCFGRIGFMQRLLP